MKILYYCYNGHETAKYDIKRLSEKCEVVVRFFGNKLSDGSLDGVTHTIQYVHPSHFIYFKNCYNVGWIDNVPDKVTTAINYLELMDDLWYSKKIPHAVDKDIYNRNYEKILNGNSDSNHEYLFYIFAESCPVEAIRAFNVEFDPNEPTNLVIISKNGYAQEINQIRNELGLYRSIEIYKKHVEINGQLSFEQAMGIHQSCNCYLATEESIMNYTYPQQLVHASCFGNHAVRGKTHTVFSNFKTSFLNEMNGWTPIEATNECELAKEMRDAYKNKRKNGVNPEDICKSFDSAIEKLKGV